MHKLLCFAFASIFVGSVFYLGSSYAQSQSAPTDEELRGLLDHCQSQLVQRPRLEFTQEFIDSCQKIGNEITRRLEAKNKPATDAASARVKEIAKQFGK